ncbi:MAG: hypothetical protein KGJ98_03350 [Chloroflexota bacterium]|nr:hypothetical protein [Chloroflexota bacterium]MDE3101249.1 hypothetical protein [Chloroflexota bacterium]
MSFDLAAAGRAFEFLGMLAAGLVTLHADFVLGFIVGAALLRRYRRGSWDDLAYAGFMAGLTIMLLLGIVFLGLRLDVPGWALFLLGLAASGIGWIASGGPPPRARAALMWPWRACRVAIARSAERLRRPRIPDRLPPDIRSFARPRG